jgi:hypothetical protein
MINRANYYFVKAINDGVITDTEYNSFIKLIDTDVLKLNTDDKKEKETDSFLVEVETMAKGLALEEFKKNKITELKTKELQTLNQKYPSV